MSSSFMSTSAILTRPAKSSSTLSANCAALSLRPCDSASKAVARIVLTTDTSRAKNQS